MRLKKLKRRASIFIQDIIKLKWMLVVFVVIPNISFLIFINNLNIDKFIEFNQDILLFLLSFFVVAFFYALTRDDPQKMSEPAGCLLFTISACIFVVLSFLINILFHH